MRKAIVTGYWGPDFQRLAAATAPLMARYAALYGHTFVCEELPVQLVDGVAVRHPAWYKLKLIQRVLEDHGLVLWLDSDVVVRRSDKDIFELFAPGSLHACVFHKRTHFGYPEVIPNTGVWLLSYRMRQILQDAWDDPDWATYPLWEQDAILRRLGFPTKTPYLAPTVTNSFYAATQQLPLEWNSIPFDQAAEPRFIHQSFIGNEPFRYEQAVLAVKESDLYVQ